MRDAARVPAVLLGAVAAGAIGLAAALWIALAPARGDPPTPVRIAPPGAPVEIAPDSLAQTERAPAGTISGAAPGSTPVALPARAGAADPEQRAEAAVLTLRAAIDPEDFSTRSFERQARVLAEGLHADAGAAGIVALERIAGDGARGDPDAVAAAELLRTLRGVDIELPGSALAALRRSWEGRAEDATLALAAAGALGRFGDIEDRRALLEGVSGKGGGIEDTLAVTGLCAARGDGAALEMTAAAEASVDPRRREVAVIALTEIAAARDPALSDAGRERCAEFFRAELRACETSRGVPVRIALGLAVLDPAALEASVLGGGMPDHSRVAVLEMIARAGRKISPEGRALLEGVRDREPGTLLGGRAAKVLARTESGTASGVGPGPGG